MLEEKASATASVTVLAYHKIGPPSIPQWPTWNYVDCDQFRGQLQYLRDHAFEILSLDAFHAALSAPESITRRSVMITFDDGYESMVTQALPILSEFGFPSVLFVPTQFIGLSNTFDHGIEPPERICSKEQLRELNQGGMSVQSHGVSHRAFSSLSLDEAKAEVRNSKLELEDILGEAVTHFAFPFGDGRVKGHKASSLLEEAGYTAASLYKGGRLDLPVDDQFVLPRLPLGSDSDLGALLEQIQ